jgi:hypothetical protein
MVESQPALLLRRTMARLAAILQDRGDLSREVYACGGFDSRSRLLGRSQLS